MTVQWKHLVSVSAECWVTPFSGVPDSRLVRKEIKGNLMVGLGPPLVFYCCCNKLPQTKQLKTMRFYKSEI